MNPQSPPTQAAARPQPTASALMSCIDMLLSCNPQKQPNLAALSKIQKQILARAQIWRAEFLELEKEELSQREDFKLSESLAMDANAWEKLRGEIGEEKCRRLRCERDELQKRDAMNQGELKGKDAIQRLQSEQSTRDSGKSEDDINSNDLSSFENESDASRANVELVIGCLIIGLYYTGYSEINPIFFGV